MYVFAFRVLLALGKVAVRVVCRKVAAVRLELWGTSTPPPTGAEREPP